MRRILIFTDLKIQALITKRYLTRLKVDSIYWTNCSVEAENIVNTEKIDLIISSVDLKNITIFDFMKKIKPTEVIVMINKRNEEELTPWFQKSKLNSICFPFSSIDLLEEINRIPGKEDLLNPPI